MASYADDSVYGYGSAYGYAQTYGIPYAYGYTSYNYYGNNYYSRSEPANYSNYSVTDDTDGIVYVSDNYYYGNAFYGQQIKESGPGQYGPFGHAQYFGGQGQYGFGYYESNSNGTITYFGYGMKIGYAIVYDSYYNQS